MGALAPIIKHFSEIRTALYSFKTADGKENNESESNIILNYAFQQPFLKGLALQYIRIDYNVEHGNDFGEDRLFVNYTKRF